jgi:hypothetical protein
MMFGTTGLQQQIDDLKASLEYDRELYWKLYHKHEALVKSLGLKQIDVPAKTEFVKEDEKE